MYIPLNVISTSLPRKDNGSSLNSAYKGHLSPPQASDNKTSNVNVHPEVMSTPTLAKWLGIKPEHLPKTLINRLEESMNNSRQNLENPNMKRPKTLWQKVTTDFQPIYHTPFEFESNPEIIRRWLPSCLHNLTPSFYPKYIRSKRDAKKRTYKNLQDFYLKRGDVVVTSNGFTVNPAKIAEPNGE